MVANLTHDSFRQPPDPTIALWRYMDLSKFAALLQSRALAFPRSDLLGDPFEGSVPVADATYWENVRKLRATWPEHDPYPEMSDEALNAFETQVRGSRRSMIKTCYVSCWHMDEAESAAMWRLYSQSSDAVCVRTSYKRLSELLPNTCFFGAVTYINFKKAALDSFNVLTPFMLKRLSFAHEREARALLWDTSDVLGEGEGPSVKHIPIDLAALIETIYVSPAAPEWFRDVVAALADKYQLSVPIEHSELNAVPMY